MTRIAVLVAGLAGLSVVVRAFALYFPSDGISMALTLLIGVGLTAGMVELDGRMRSLGALGLEIRQLPVPGHASVAAGASPSLRLALLARLRGATSGGPAPLFASSLLGLLVMVGLLGTFLGLFETLRGAREALTSSTEVAALRAGLVAPLRGLARAFGCSAAGVSSAAALGLALALVRQRESAVIYAVARYATEQLAPFSIAERTLAAVEAMAAQGESLARISAQLRHTARAIEGQSEQLGERAAFLHQGLLESGKSAVDQMARATVSLQAQQESQQERSSRELADLMVTVQAEQHSQQQRTSRELADLARATHEQIAQALVQQSSANHEAVAELCRSAEEAQVRQAEELRRAMSEGGLQLFAQALEALSVRVSTRTEDELTSMAELLHERLEGSARQDERAEARVERLLARVEQLSDAAGEQAERHGKHFIELSALLERAHVSTSAACQQELQRIALQLETVAERHLNVASEGSRTVQLGADSMAATIELFGGAVDRYRHTTHAWIAGLDSLRAAAEQAAQGDARDLLTAYIDHTREVFEQSFDLQKRLIAELHQRPSGGG